MRLQLALPSLAMGLALGLAACGGAGNDATNVPAVQATSVSPTEDMNVPTETESPYVSSVSPLEPSESESSTPAKKPAAAPEPKSPKVPPPPKGAKPVKEKEFIKPKHKNGEKPPPKKPKGKVEVFPDDPPASAREVDDGDNKKPKRDPRAGQVVVGGHPNTLCNNPGANIYEAYAGARIQQTTYYCWSATGYGVFWIGKGDLVGWTDGLRWAAQINWKGIDSQFNQCYPYNGRVRGYCVQTTYGHFEQQLGPISPNINIWTMVRLWYNGYAECANAHDNRWTTCS